MDADFPAAHSMDCSWYAVDRHGNVGLFSTGEEGAVPDGAYSPDAAAEMLGLDEEERAEYGFDAEDVIPEEHLPDDKRVFFYSADLQSSLYGRSRRPRKPVHVDELPPDAREAVGRVRFETIDFAASKTLQPCELTACSAWSPYYLASDGKTFRPVPGREDEYAKEVKRLRQEFGDEYTFEDPPPKKKRPPRAK